MNTLRSRTASHAWVFAFASIAIVAACKTTDPDPEAPPPPTVPVGTPCKADDACGGGRCELGACVPGARCQDDSACTAGTCKDGVCVAAIASDDTKNGDETDVDCGGSIAPRCPDGKVCAGPTDCANKSCIAGVCAPPSATDGLQNGTESDVDCGGTAPTNAPKCDDGKNCKAGSDCKSLSCDPDGKCIPPTSTDTIQNGTETDVDCGGAGPTNAARCDATKKCVAAEDCFWGHCNAGVCGGHVPGTQDGDQTDIDCGGTKSPACDWYKGCKIDDDCTTKACDPDKKCAVGPSCKTVHGGSTCGTGEFNDANKNHESCCRSLPVAGYPLENGKQVYVDKYEITAGRMRAFITALTAAAGAPDVKSWIAAHRPSRWNVGWENFLPTSNVGPVASFTVARPTVDLLNPGQDQFLANHPTQSSWWIKGPDPTVQQANGQSSDYQLNMGVFYAMGGGHLFPEYYSTPSWGSTDYSAAHALNCFNGTGSYGYGTYWFDDATTHQYSGAPLGQGKYFSQDVLDEKALTCTPNALFAAFCAWDGGQLATAEVMDAITGNTQSPIFGSTAAPNNLTQNGKLAPGNSTCGPGGGNLSPNNTLITYSDGGSVPCGNVYYYPPDGGNTWDGSARIAPPGRVPADVVRMSPGDEPWMDMIGNLEEAVLKKGEVARFDFRGFGTEWGSIQHHRNQQTTPRNKGGAFGARCMRVK